MSMNIYFSFCSLFVRFCFDKGESLVDDCSCGCCDYCFDSDVETCIVIQFVTYASFILIKAATSGEFSMYPFVYSSLSLISQVLTCCLTIRRVLKKGTPQQKSLLKSKLFLARNRMDQELNENYQDSRQDSVNGYRQILNGEQVTLQFFGSILKGHRPSCNGMNLYALHLFLWYRVCTYYQYGFTVSVSDGSSVNAETMPLISKSRAMKFACSTELRMKGKVSLKFNRVIFILNYNKQFIIIVNIMIQKCLGIGTKNVKIVNKIIHTMAYNNLASVIYRPQFSITKTHIPAYYFTNDKPLQSNKIKIPLQQLLSKYKSQPKQLSNSQSGTLLKQLLQHTNNKVSNLQQNIKIQDYICQILINFNNFIQSQGVSKWQNKQNIYYVIRVIGCLSLHNFIKVINRFGNQDKRESILRIAKDKKLAEIVITLFQSQDYLGRTKIIKFVTKFHNQDSQIMKKLSNTVRKSTNKQSKDLKQLIFYLKQVTKLSSHPNSSPDLIIDLSLFRQAISRSQQNILLVDPQMLFILSQSMLVLSKIKNKPKESKKILQTKFLIQGVRQHVKGLQLIDAKNLNDGVYLVQVLENVKDIGISIQGGANQEQIKQLGNSIYSFIKNAFKRISQSVQQQQLSQTQPQDEQQKTAQTSSAIPPQSPLTATPYISQIDINILQQSMLSLQIIDPTLFTVLQQLFFININKQVSHLYDIQSYIYTRIKISKAVMTSLREDTSNNNNNNNNNNNKSKGNLGTVAGTVSNNNNGGRVRVVKQQHKKFITRLIQQLNNQNGSVINNETSNKIDNQINKDTISDNQIKKSQDIDQKDNKILNTSNNNETYSIQQKLKILQICQKLPIKSKQIKRIITQMMQKHKDDKQLNGFAETIKSSF